MNRPLSWSSRFRAREYLRGSLWVLPLLAVVVASLLAALDVQLDRSVTVPSYWQYSPSTASTVLSAITAATAALTGFVVTVSVLVVQMATGTFSARYLRLWYRDRMLRASLAVLVGTLVFSFSLLRRIESNFVPNIGVTVAGVLLVVSVLLFLLFLDRAIHRLRPVAVAALVAGGTRQAFEDSVVALRAPENAGIVLGRSQIDGEPELRVASTQAGAVQAVDYHGVLRWARQHDCLVVLSRVVGDFVIAGATLMEVRGNVPDDAERRLRGMVALGVERTIEQDPAFGLRIIVDIALMALSPAVNAPTTAIQVIDHLAEILRLIGTTELTPPPPRNGGPGPGNLIIPIRRWEEFLSLGVTEIRLYGASGIQVTRRLRAMLEELRDDVRPEHRAAVDDELDRLTATVNRSFRDSADLDRALTPDPEGLGGLLSDGGR
jgi:uncharacterized membrane protein